MKSQNRTTQERPMNLNPSRRNACVLFAAVVVAFAAALCITSASAQDQQWQIMRADYGYKSQRSDVTDLVVNLLARGGVNGRVAVNNQTMGGDPAPGANKSLRIFARDNRDNQHEFDYGEGGAVPVNLFVIQNAGPSDWGNGDQNRGGPGRDRDRGDRNSLTIIRGYYGVQGNMVSVTDLLQGLVRNGTLTVSADNRSMGMDPAPGADKLLIVVYSFHGQEQAMAASEGHSLSLP
jgi:hypothetical protein